jgi:hypothetical protein
LNFAVIKLSSRKYPGILIQGDSLMGFLRTTGDLIKLIDGDREEALEAITGLRDELRWRLERYTEATKNFQSED